MTASSSRQRQGHGSDVRECHCTVLCVSWNRDIKNRFHKRCISRTAQAGCAIAHAGPSEDCPTTNHLLGTERFTCLCRANNGNASAAGMGQAVLRRCVHLPKHHSPLLDRRHPCHPGELLLRDLGKRMLPNQRPDWSWHNQGFLVRKRTVS